MMLSDQLRLEFDAAVHEQIRRYRMTTLRVASQLPQAIKMRRKGVARRLRELCRDGKISSATLYAQHRYYFETTRGEASLSQDAKIRNFAMLAFCCCGQAERKRLTADELTEHLPQSRHYGVPRSYYLDLSHPMSRLGLLRVDTGGHGRWDRVLAKLKQDARLHYARSDVRQWLEQDAFEITLLTARPQKARRLAEAIEATPMSESVPLRIAVLPELVHLIAPLPMKKGRR